MHASFWLVGLLLALAALAGAASVASSAPPSENERTNREMMERAHEDALAAEKRDREARRTPDARAERQRSRSAHAGLNQADARSAALRAFPQYMAGQESPLGRFDQNPVRRYLGTHSAVVEQAEGGPTVALSSTPVLTSDGEPVDLRVHRTADGFGAKAPLVPVRIGSSAEDGVSVGGTTVRPAGVTGRAGEIAAGSVLYANTAPDADYVVKPVSLGVEFAWLVRSPAAPEAFQLEFDPGPGRTMREDDDGGIEILEGAAVVQRLGAPMAVDAQGERVAADMSLAGTTVEVRMPHRAKDVAYPVLLDPVLYSDDRTSIINHWNAYNGHSAWERYDSSGNLYWVYSGPGNEGHGLYLGNFEGRCLGYDSYAKFYWRQPDMARSTYLPRVDFNGIFADIWGDWFTDLTIFSNRDGVYQKWDSYSQPLNGSHRHSTITNGLRGDQAEFMFRSRGYCSGRHQFLNEAVLHFRDREAPTVTGVGSGDDGWSKGGARSRNITASDPGFGVHSVGVQGAGVDSYAYPGCEANPNASPCPTSWTGTVYYDTSSLATGSHTFSGKAADVLTPSALSAQKWQVKIDKSAPDVPSLSGPVLAAGGVTPGPSYALDVDATDSHSGVRRYEVLLDNAAFTGNASTNSCSAPAGCPNPAARKTFNIPTNDLSYGTHTLKVRIWDALENGPAENTATFQIADKKAPALSVAGTLPQKHEEHVEGAGYTIRASATDPSSGSAAAAGSGVKSIEVLTDGTVRNTTTDRKEQTCTQPGCTMSFDWTFDPAGLADGAHTIVVRTTDHAGNVADSPSLRVFVDADKPRLELSGDLKEGAGTTFGSGNFRLTARAADGADESPRSGVKRTQFFVGLVAPDGTVPTEEMVHAHEAQPGWSANLFSNASFERESGRRGAPGIGGYQGTVERVSSLGVEHGDFALRLRPASTAVAQAINDIERVAVTPGEKLTLSAYLRASGAGARANIGARWFDDNGAFVNQAGTTDHALSNRRKRYSANWTVPPGVTSIGWVVTSMDHAAGSYLDIDGLQFERGEGTTIFAPRLRNNLFSNTSFERAGGVWGAPIVAPYQATVDRVSGEGVEHGSWALRLRPNSAAIAQAINDQERAPVREGDVLTFSAYLRASAAGGRASISPRWFGPTGAYVSQGGVAEQPVAITRERFTGRWTVPTGVTSIGWVVTLDGHAAGSYLDIDALQVEPGPAAGEYVVASTTNLFSNMSFERAFGVAGAPALGAHQATVARVGGTGVEHGEWALQLRPASTATAQAINDGEKVSVRQGETLAFSGYLRASAAGGRASISPRWFDAAGLFIGQGGTTDHVVSTTRQRYSSTWTVPAGVASIGWVVTLSGHAAGSTLDADGLQVERGTFVYPFRAARATEAVLSSSWTLDHPATRVPGKYRVRVQTEDNDGRVSSDSVEFSLVDVTSPTAVLSGTAWDDRANTQRTPPGLVVDAADDSSGVARIAVTVDGVAQTPYATENGGARQRFTFNGLADGSRKIRVEVHDVAGNPPWVKEWTILYDANGPRWSSGPTHTGRATWNRDGTATVTATAADDASATAPDYGAGIKSIELLRGTTVMRTDSAGSCTGKPDSRCPRSHAVDPPFTYSASSTTDFPTDGMYTMTLRATDASGRPPLDHTWQFGVDRVAPDATLTGEMRPNGPLLTTSSAADLVVTPSDATSGVASVELFVTPEGGAEVAHPNVGTTAGTWRFDFGTYQEGNHRLRLVVKDSAGNVMPQAAWNVIVDRNGPRWSSGPTHTGRPAGLWTNGASATVTATAADDLSSAALGYGAGVKSIELLRGTTVMRSAPVPAATCTGKPAARCPRTLTPASPFSYSASSTTDFPTDGVYTMTLRATDAAGRPPLDHTWQFGVDRTLPTVKLSDTAWDKKATTFTSGAPALLVDATDTGSGFSKMIVKVDNVERTPMTTENGGARQRFSFTGLADGARTIHVEVHDAAGNVWTTPDWSILYDANAPRVTGVDDPNRPTGWTNGFAATATVSATDVPPGAWEHGTGIKTLKLLRNDAEWKEHRFPCEGTPASRCAATGSAPLPYAASEFPDGIHTLRAVAVDGDRESYRDNLAPAGARALAGAAWSYGSGQTSAAPSQVGPFGGATLHTIKDPAVYPHLRVSPTRIPVLGGEKYVVSHYTKAVNASGTRYGGAYIYFFRADGTVTHEASQYTTGEAFGTDGWRRYAATASAPADAVTMQPTFYLLNAAAVGEQHYFSNARVEAMPSNNLVLSGARAMSGAGAAQWKHSNSTVAAAPGVGPFGEATLLTFGDPAVYPHMRASHDGPIPVQAGEPYAVSFFTKAALSSTEVRRGGPYVDFRKADGTSAGAGSSYTYGEAYGTDGWRKYTGTFVAPPGATVMRVSYTLLNVALGEQHHFSNARVELASPGATSWQVKIDRQAPKVTVPVSALKMTNTFEVEVDDRDNGADRSGVRSVDMYVDGQYYSSGAVTCASTGCAQTWRGSFFVDPTRYSEGTHTVKFVARDDAGNAGQVEHTVYIIGTAGVDRSKLGIEDWFQYDTTKSGAGTSVRVNAATGNTLWRSDPINNRGRGLDSTITLTYNAFDRGGYLASLLRPDGVPLLGPTAKDLVGVAYGEAGLGFSLGSGLTRLNEPLAGVGFSDLGVEIDNPEKITLTDGDGTGHVFTRDAARPGFYVEPPGVHLKLRKHSAADPARRWAMTRPDGVTHFFDRMGYQTFVSDRNANTIRFNYEQYSKVTGKVEDCLQTPTLPLTGANLTNLCAPRVRRIVDAAGVEAEPVQPQRGAEGAVAESRSLKIEYYVKPLLSAPDAASVTAVKTELAKRTTNELRDLLPIAGAPGRVHKIVDHGGRVTEFVYDADGGLRTLAQGEVLAQGATPGSTADRREFQLEYEGSNQNRLLHRIADPLRSADNITNTAGPLTTIHYEAAEAPGPVASRSVGRRADWVRNRRSNITAYDYPTGKFTVKAPGPRTTTYTLEPGGRTDFFVDALNRTTDLTWDGDNNLIAETRALGTADVATVSSTYNRHGQPLRRTDVNGVTTYGYCEGTEWTYNASCADDGKSYVSDHTSISYAAGHSVTYFLDARGNRRGHQYSGYPRTWIDVDAKGHVTREVDELGHQTTYRNFDPNGLPREKTDPRGNDAKDEDFLPRDKPDAAGNDPDGKLTNGIWRYQYDNLGNVLATADPRATEAGAGKAYNRSFTYDAFDRPVEWRVQRSATETTIRSKRYDLNGNVEHEKDGDQKMTSYAYTPMDRVETVTSPPVDHAATSYSPAGVAAETMRIGYDERENVSFEEAPNGVRSGVAGDWTTSFKYDAADQLISKTQQSRGTPGEPDSDLTTSFAYDNRGNVIGVADPKRNASGDPIANAANPAKQRLKLTYDKADNRTFAYEDPSGLNLTTEFRYDPSNRLKVTRPPRYFKATTDAERAKFETTSEYDSRNELKSRKVGDRRTDYLRRDDGSLGALVRPRGTATTADASDYTTSYGYYADGTLKSVRLPKAGLRHEEPQAPILYVRNEVGEPTKIVDARGNSVTNEFLRSGELRSTSRPSLWDVEIAPNGQELREKPYEQWGDHSQRTELPSGQGHGDHGEVARQPLPALMPDAGATQFGYDREHRLDRVTDAAGKATTLGRDALGRLTGVTYPFTDSTSISTSNGYDYNGQLVSEVDGANQRTTTLFDQFGRKSRRTSPGAARVLDGPTPDEVTDWKYDLNGNLKTLTPPTRKSMTFEYDTVDRLVSERDALSHNTTYGYDEHGNQTCTRAPRGNEAGAVACAAGPYSTIRKFTPYDELERAQVNPDRGDPAVWSYVYDDDGNQVEEVAPGSRRVKDGAILAQKTKRTFDGRGLPFGETTYTGADDGIKQRTIVTEYDPNGNLRRSVDSKGVVETTGRPEWDDLRQDGKPTGEEARHATVHVYDANNLLVSRWLPWGDADDQDLKRYHQDFERDHRGRIKWIDAAHSKTDERTSRVTYGHYDTGWIKSISEQRWVDPASNDPVPFHDFEFSYDKRGNQLSWTTGGRESRREYYPNGQLRLRTARKDASDPETRTYKYAYEADGQLATMRDNQQAREWKVAYDDAGRLVRVNEAWDTGKDSVFTYDKDDNLTSRSTDGRIDPNDVTRYTGGKRTTFDLDSIGREYSSTVNETEKSTQQTTTTSWFPSGQMAQRTKHNGTVESWLYDADGRTRTMRRQRANAAAGTYAKDQSYTYDRNGNRISDERGSHTFDARDRLVRWERKANALPGGVDVSAKTVTYTLNGSGAIVRKVDDGVTTKNTVQGDRLLKSELYAEDVDADAAGATPEATLTYDYDALGNVKDIATHETALDRTTHLTYTYDAFGRMTRAKGPGVEDSDNGFSYDGLDRRDWKCVVPAGTPDSACTGGSKFDYGYVGLTERLSSERTATERRTYNYDARLQPIGQNRLKADGSHTYSYFGSDLNGSVEAVEDASGSTGVEIPGVKATTNTYAYDPYGDLDGEATLGLDAKANPVRFEGFYFEDGLKTYDMHARSYRTDIARFLQPDRYESAAADVSLMSDPSTQNRYAFGGANPVGRVEIDGHISPDAAEENNEAANVRKGDRTVSHTTTAGEQVLSRRHLKRFYPVGQSDAISDGGVRKVKVAPDRGVTDAVPDMIESTKQLFTTDPRKTAKALWHSATHPIQTAKAIAGQCDNHTVEYCLTIVGAELVGAKGGLSVLRNAARQGDGGPESGPEPESEPWTRPPGSVRKQDYPHDYRKATKPALEEAATGPDGVIRCQSATCAIPGGRPLAEGEGTAEHDPPLWETHNSIGYDTTQSVRNDLYNDTATAWHCSACQNSQGGQTTGRYRRDVGPNYEPRPRRKR